MLAGQGSIDKPMVIASSLVFRPPNGVVAADSISLSSFVTITLPVWRTSLVDDRLRLI